MDSFTYTEIASPCCGQNMYEADGCNCDVCPVCFKWYLVVKDPDTQMPTIFEVI